jgi:ribosomal protein S5
MSRAKVEGKKESKLSSGESAVAKMPAGRMFSYSAIVIIGDNNSMFHPKKNRTHTPVPPAISTALANVAKFS